MPFETPTQFHERIAAVSGENGDLVALRRDELVEFLEGRFFGRTEKTKFDAKLAIDEFLEIKKYRGPNLRIYPGKPTYNQPGQVKQDIEWLYFYYFAFDKKNRLFCKFFSEKLQTKNIFPESRIIYLIDDARKLVSLAQSDPVDNVKWEHPSFMVFMLDTEGWVFFEEEKSDEQSAYLHQRTRVENHSLCFAEYDNFKKNQSFFNAETIEVFPNSENGKILVATNYHVDPRNNRPRRRDANGNKPDPDDYKFDLFFRVGLASPGGRPPVDTEPFLTLIIDPSGKNTGP